MDERFERMELLLGAEAVTRLRAARVLVAGLGAVGSYATEALARAGIGTLRLVDFDTVHPSNINRQLYALCSTLGRPKVDVAAERVRDINPDAVVEARRTFITAATVEEVVSGGFDAVVDAIDSLNPKVLLLRAAVGTGAFVVSSMGAATRTDPSAVRAGDLFASRHCPLARLVRKRLRRLGVTGGIRCVYSEEPARKRPAPASAPVEPIAGDRGRVRPPLGSVSYLTGLFGLVAAGEVIRRLAGEKQPCAGHGSA